MPITGGLPESGLRLELERALEGGPPWTYVGHALTSKARYPVEIVVDDSGEVTLGGLPPELGDVATKARLIVRTAYKHAKDADSAAPPPRRIVRWRAG